MLELALPKHDQRAEKQRRPSAGLPLHERSHNTQTHSILGLRPGVTVYKIVWTGLLHTHATRDAENEGRVSSPQLRLQTSEYGSHACPQHSFLSG